MNRLRTGLAVVFAVASSAPCFAEESVAGEHPRHLFEWGVRAGVGVEHIGPAFHCMGGCPGLWVDAGPRVGFDTYLRVGTDNLRWQNQLSFVFAKHTNWTRADSCEGASNCDDFLWTGGRIPLFVEATFTTGFELNTNPPGDLGFLWELGLTGGGWTSIGTSASGPLIGGKMGLGAMMFHDWELSAQFIAGNFFSAQVLFGYNVQWGR